MGGSHWELHTGWDLTMFKGRGGPVQSRSSHHQQETEEETQLGIEHLNFHFRMLSLISVPQMSGLISQSNEY